MTTRYRPLVVDPLTNNIPYCYSSCFSSVLWWGMNCKQNIKFGFAVLLYTVDLPCLTFTYLVPFHVYMYIHSCFWGGSSLWGMWTLFFQNPAKGRSGKIHLSLRNNKTAAVWIQNNDFYAFLPFMSFFFWGHTLD